MFGCMSLMRTLHGRMDLRYCPRWDMNSLERVIFVGAPGPFGLGGMNNHCWCTSFGHDLRSATDVISHN
ncbi:hypothetical protein M6B38_332105 [Iris pallida]|uniref:Uncharacterized protein n=1 Tax=Iris pallida TaxID=29817 RepID=A0AAX6H4F5_IRIPA|nr:hypothetical protein M6B38_332105 [Iris pallida]